MSKSSYIYHVEYRNAGTDQAGWFTAEGELAGDDTDLWIGPYTTEAAAHDSIRQALEAVLGDLTKIELGIL